MYPIVPKRPAKLYSAGFLLYPGQPALEWGTITTTLKGNHMRQCQSEEFSARSHTLTMQLLDEAGRQFEETRRLARRPWWVPLAIAVPVALALLGFGPAFEVLLKW